MLNNKHYRDKKRREIIGQVLRQVEPAQAGPGWAASLLALGGQKCAHGVRSVLSMMCLAAHVPSGGSTAQHSSAVQGGWGEGVCGGQFSSLAVRLSTRAPHFLNSKSRLIFSGRPQPAPPASCSPAQASPVACQLAFMSACWAVLWSARFACWPCWPSITQSAQHHSSDVPLPHFLGCTRFSAPDTILALAILSPTCTSLRICVPSVT